MYQRNRIWGEDCQKSTSHKSCESEKSGQQEGAAPGGIIKLCEQSRGPFIEPSRIGGKFTEKGKIPEKNRLLGLIKEFGIDAKIEIAEIKKQ